MLLGALRYDLLRSFPKLYRYDLELREHLRLRISVFKNTNICDVFNHFDERGVGEVHTLAVEHTIVIEVMA